MRIKLFASALIFAVSTALVALPFEAQAGRIGGGKSFGSRPSMSVPAQRPASPYQSSATTSPYQRPATSSPYQRAPQPAPRAQQSGGGLFSGFGGGMLGGLLAGGLIGSLFSGSHNNAAVVGNGAGAAAPAQQGGGIGLLDILLFGILIYLVVRIFKKRRQAAEPEPEEYARNDGYAYQGGGAPSDPMRRDASNANGWSLLQGSQGGDPSYGSDIPADFDVEGFLRGAKMAYNRLQSSWDARDIADIANFATPAVVQEIRSQMMEDPNPSKTQILLVNARLLSVREFGDQDCAEVYFDVVMREDPRQPQTEQVREIWHFARPHAGGSWKLDGIQQVED